MASNAGNVDIVFLIDATGSMSSCIDAVKNSVKQFSNELLVQDANGGRLLKDWRAAVVGYRDITHTPENWLEVNQFVSNEDELEKQLEALEAVGGGDEPESFLEALYCVIRWKKSEEGANGADPLSAQGWRDTKEARRCVLFFTDATFPHQLVSPPGVDIEAIQQLIVQENIILCGVYPSMLSDCFQPLSILPKTYLHQCPADPADPTNPQAALNSFSASRDVFGDLIKRLAATISKQASQGAAEAL